MVGRRGWYCQKGHVASRGPAPGCQSWRCQTTKPWHEGHTVTPWEEETRTLLSECLAWRFLSHVKPYLKTPDEEPAVESPREAAGGSGDWLGRHGWRERRSIRDGSLDLELSPELVLSVEMICLYLTYFQRLKEDSQQGADTHH